MVLTVSPSDCSCRVQCDTDNHTFLLNGSKLVRDPAFAYNDVNDGGALNGTPGDVTSPRDAMRRTSSPVTSPLPGVRRRLRFLGLQHIPNPVDEVAGSDAVLTIQPPDPDPVPSQGGSGAPVTPEPVMTRAETAGV